MKTALDFVRRYLADESFRDEVIRHEEDGLLKFGIPQPKIDPMVSLKLDRIKPLLEQEYVDQGVSANDAPALVDALIEKLKEAGFDIQRAYDIIRDGHYPCQPQMRDQKTEKPAQILATGAYGAGEVHIRKLTPVVVYSNVTSRIEVAGQGFPLDVNVAFTPAANTAVQPQHYARLVQRRAEVDVHQYLTVEFDFPAIGAWYARVKNVQQVWVPSECTITAL